MERQTNSRDRIGAEKDHDDSVVGVPTHPVAATVGALAAGGATGAVIGTAAGPVGTPIGARRTAADRTSFREVRTKITRVRTHWAKERAAAIPWRISTPWKKN